MQQIYVESELTPFQLPRQQLRFPLALRQPRGFKPHRPQTWPRLDGRLEFVAGELLFMPPGADFQQDVSAETIRLLGNWSVLHPDYVVAGNEAGMLLGGEVRGADAAVWKRGRVGTHRGTFRRVPPVLAVEIAGEDEEEQFLRQKARWYLKNGVESVWLVFPRTRAVVVITGSRAQKIVGKKLLPAPSLPGLKLSARDLFRQLGSGDLT